MSRPSDFKHCTESDQIIREGYARQASVHSIAKKLRVTNNVVIGRARRLGLSNPQNHFLATSRGHTSRWSPS